MKEKLIEIVNSFKGKRIGVIGDLMLDRFIFGDTERISPEAPVPVVFAEKESFMPGGAGNTANNIAALGGKVFMIGAVGEDGAGQQLINELKKKGIDTEGVVKTPAKPTTQKIRVIARGQQVVRIDKEDARHIDGGIEKNIVDLVSSRIKGWDALVISDYAKGFITETLAQEIISLAKRHQKVVIVDPRPKHALYFKGASIFAPNQKEALEIAKTEEVEKAGKIIQEQLNCNVLITRGAEGMSLFEEERVKYFPAKAREVFDVAGAGDTVVASLSLVLASGGNFEEAAIIANHSAGLVVGKVGTATISPEELINDLKNNG